MRNSISKTKKRLLPLLAASALLAGGTGAALLFAGGTADAAPCDAGTACTITGSLDLTSGAMNLTPPAGLAWGAPITGADQSMIDTTAADQTYTVLDATGTAPGWNVTASATPFAVATLVTGGAPVGTTLGTAGATTSTFFTNGSASDPASTLAPDANCSTGSTCTPPTNLLATAGYPVTITAGQAASTAPEVIYDAAVATGLGTIVIGNNGATGTNPVGWWLNVPSNTIAGIYTSTVSVQLNSGP